MEAAKEKKKIIKHSKVKSKGACLGKSNNMALNTGPYFNIKRGY